MAAAGKPVSRYGEPKPVETYKPQDYRPVLYQKVPVNESSIPGNGGKYAGLKAKIASIKEAIHSRLKIVKPFIIGFKAGAILVE